MESRWKVRISFVSLNRLTKRDFSSFEDFVDSLVTPAPSASVSQSSLLVEQRRLQRNIAALESRRHRYTTETVVHCSERRKRNFSQRGLLTCTQGICLVRIIGRCNKGDWTTVLLCGDSLSVQRRVRRS